MLPRNWHRRFAQKQALDNQEHRLLFAVENDDPLSRQEYFAGAGVNPDGTLQEDPNQQSAVDGNVDQTRSDIGATMTSSEQNEDDEKKAPVEYGKLLRDIRSTQEKLSKVTSNQEKTKKLIREKIPADQRKDYLADLEKCVLYSEMAQRSLNGYARAAETVQQLRDGMITPEYFEREFLSITSDGSAERLEGFDAATIRDRLADIDQRGLKDPEYSMERDAVFTEALESESLQVVAKFIEGEVSSIQKALNPIEGYIEELEREDVNTEDGNGFSWGRFWEGMMSIKDVINGTKRYYEAIKKSYEEWNQLKEANIAQKWGRALSWIPLGEQTQAVLDRQTEKLNDDIRDEEKQRLETMRPSFSMIIEMLDRAKQNPHRFRAVLEYAAERAWLYDYDAVSGTVFGINIVNHLPNTWNEENKKEYLRDLDNKNGSGESSEKDRGYNRVSTYSDIPPIVDILHDELRRGNFWASHGILKRAMEKGKEGETSTWISVTIFRYLRDNPDARKYFPKNLLDDIGNVGIGHPAWTSTWFKFNRGQIVEWQKTDEESPANAGTLGEVIAIAEDHLRSELGSARLKNTEELDRYVAQILASQTVEVDGKKFSIFDKRYDNYRQELEKAPTNVDAKAADEDFYNIENRGSEMVLLGNKSYKNMLNLTSLGEFADTMRSSSFLEQLISREKDLKNSFGVTSPHYRSFTQSTRKKLQTWLFANANDDRASEKIGYETLPGSEDYIFLSLIKSGLMDLESIYLLDKSKLSKIVTRQILEEKPPCMPGAQMKQIADHLREKGRMTEGRHAELIEIIVKSKDKTVT